MRLEDHPQQLQPHGPLSELEQLSFASHELSIPEEAYGYAYRPILRSARRHGGHRDWTAVTLFRLYLCL